MSQFHLDFINGILDKILNGEINTREALNLLRQASIENNEIIIEDVGSIKKCVEILLKYNPEELKRYYEVVKKNSGRRSPYKGNIGKPKIGFYHEREEKFKDNNTLIENTSLTKYRKKSNIFTNLINKIKKIFFS